MIIKVTDIFAYIDNIDLSLIEKCVLNNYPIPLKQRVYINDVEYYLSENSDDAKVNSIQEQGIRELIKSNKIVLYLMKDDKLVAFIGAKVNS